MQNHLCLRRAADAPCFSVQTVTENICFWLNERARVQVRIKSSSPNKPNGTKTAPASSFTIVSELFIAREAEQRESRVAFQRVGAFGTDVTESFVLADGALALSKKKKVKFQTLKAENQLSETEQGDKQSNGNEQRLQQLNLVKCFWAKLLFIFNILLLYFTLFLP